jgi:hypothetical protein
VNVCRGEFVAILDRAAELTLHVHTHFDELRQFYTEFPHGQLVLARLRTPAEHD